MKELELSLKTIARNLKEKRQYITSEAVTISSLIDPLIQALHYDTTDPRQIHREHNGQWSNKNYKNTFFFRYLAK